MQRQKEGKWDRGNVNWKNIVRIIQLGLDGWRILKKTLEQNFSRHVNHESSEINLTKIK